MNKKDQVFASFLSKERTMVQPMGNKCGLSTTFISSQDERFVLDLNLVLLFLCLSCSTIDTFSRFRLGLLLLLVSTRAVAMHLAISHCNLCFDEIVKVSKMSLVTIKLSTNKDG